MIELLTTTSVTIARHADNNVLECSLLCNNTCQGDIEATKCSNTTPTIIISLTEIVKISITQEFIIKYV